MGASRWKMQIVAAIMVGLTRAKQGHARANSTVALIWERQGDKRVFAGG